MYQQTLNLLFGVILLLMVVHSKTNKLKPNMEVTSFATSSKYDNSWIDWQTMRLTKTAPNTFVVSGDVTLVRNLGDEQKVDIKVYRKSIVAKTYTSPVYTATKPICKYISTDNTVYPTLLKHSDLPKSDICPIPKGEYKISNVVFDADTMPDSIPSGEYKVILTIYDGSKDIAGFEGEFALTRE